MATLTTILAIISFSLPIVYKYWKREKTELADLTKCTLAAMGLPNLLVCLFYLVTDPSEAIKMAEVTQYLSISVLIIIYLTVTEIRRIFDEGKLP